MKIVEIEFPAGTKVFVMNGSQPVETTVRAAQALSCLAVKGKPESEVTHVTYSTELNPNSPLKSTQLAETKEKLSEKLFGAANNVPDLKKDIKKPADKNQL